MQDAHGTEITAREVADTPGRTGGDAEVPSWADALRDDPWAAQREIEDERHAEMATPSTAHAEWHRNAGVPMGTPGCPQDACHLPDDWEPEPGPGEGIRCAHCKERHWSVADVRACAAGPTAPASPIPGFDAEKAAANFRAYGETQPTDPPF